MKKTAYGVIVIAIAFIMTGMFTACGGSKKQEIKPKKVLVAYFSATGNTKKTAEDIAKVFGATLHEITPKVAYTEADLDWNDSTSRSSREMHDASNRPAIIDSVPDIKQYDMVLIGFPIWWGVAPSIVNSFIEKNDLKGKPLIVFATSGGSPVQSAYEALKKQYPDLKWWDCARLLNTASEAGLEKWKSDLGL